jgi:hypothetical protein
VVADALSEDMEQLLVSPEMADAGLQLLAATCCEWQQQLADLWEQQQQASSSRQEQLPLQPSLLAQWKQPLQQQLSPDRIAAAAGNAHQLVLQQQLGPAAAAVHQQGCLELLRSMDNASSAAADLATTSVAALRQHLGPAWGKVQTAAIPAVWGDSHMLPSRGVRVWVVYLTPKIERIIVLLSASPEGEARLPMPKGMAYKE